MTTRLPLTQPDAPAARIAAHLAGDADLTGLELYYELERATPLLDLHLLLRAGPRNRAGNGLQQSYGDHNRLLLLGLDRLLEGDVPWLAARVLAGEDVTEADLAEVVAAVDGLGLDRAARVALWLGAGLHDAGMLCGRGQHVDVEDGVVLGDDVLTGLCPPDLVGLARFAIRHHDYVKDVFLGEVPADTVAMDLELLPRAQRAVAMGVLGMIQVAGSASLGEGRLTRFRIDVFRACIDGSALADRSPQVRAARLLRPATEATAPPAPMTGLTRDVESLLRVIPLHGWHKAVADRSIDDRRTLLAELVERGEAARVHHISLPEPVPGALGEQTVVESLSGRRILVVQAE